SQSKEPIVRIRLDAEANAELYPNKVGTDSARVHIVAGHRSNMFERSQGKRTVSAKVGRIFINARRFFVGGAEVAIVSHLAEIIGAIDHVVFFTENKFSK